MSRMFSSLAIPNYRNYAIGGLVSNTGVWMQRTAQSWLVLVTLTNNDARALGLVTGLQFLPVLLFSAAGGALADRFSKRHVMMWTQTVMGINSLILGVLITTGQIQLWMVYVSAFILGTASAVDAPARQAFVSEMVPKGQLSNAISLNSASFNSARLFGPATAGLVIAAGGTGPVFLIDAASFAFVLIALATLNKEQLHPAPRSTGKGQIRDGLRYVRNRPDVMVIMVIAFMMGTFGMNFQITNVLMATEAFGQGAAQYGMLGSIMAIGSLTAALLSARRSRPRLRHLLISMAAFTVSSLLSALAPNFITFCILLVPVGLTAISTLVTANALVQMSVAETVRGRVMSLYMMLLMGGTPIGAPVLGWIGEQFGARWTIGIGVVAMGLTFIVATSYLMRRDNLHLSLDHHRPFVTVERNLTDDSLERME